MRSLSESITKRLDAYNESILSSNNAKGIIRQILDIFREQDSVDNMVKLRELWDETEFLISNVQWHFPVTAEGYNYEWIGGDTKGSIVIAIRKKKYMYIRKNTLPPKIEREIIKCFNLKSVNLPNTNDTIFKTYEF